MEHSRPSKSHEATDRKPCRRARSRRAKEDDRGEPTPQLHRIERQTPTALAAGLRQQRRDQNAQRASVRRTGRGRLTVGELGACRRKQVHDMSGRRPRHCSHPSQHQLIERKGVARDGAAANALAVTVAVMTGATRLTRLLRRTWRGMAAPAGIRVPHRLPIAGSHGLRRHAPVLAQRHSGQRDGDDERAKHRQDKVRQDNKTVSLQHRLRLPSAQARLPQGSSLRGTPGSARRSLSGAAGSDEKIDESSRPPLTASH